MPLSKEKKRAKKRHAKRGARVEIERRFLVRDGALPTRLPGEFIQQGYLATKGPVTVRVRRVGERAFLTIKGKRKGGARPEFEYEIRPEEADAMLEDLCPHPLIEKTRFAVHHAGLLWHVDIYAGALAGLAIAECELDRPDQPIELPDWVGIEITGDPRFRNSRLSRLKPEAAIRKK